MVQIAPALMFPNIHGISYTDVGAIYCVPTDYKWFEDIFTQISQ